MSTPVIVDAIRHAGWRAGRGFLPRFARTIWPLLSSRKLSSGRTGSRAGRGSLFWMRQPGGRRQPQRGAHGRLLAGLPVEVGGSDRQPAVRLGVGGGQLRRRVPSGQGRGRCSSRAESNPCRARRIRFPKQKSGYSFGNLTAYDTALGWRYPNPKMKEMYGTDSMGETAENIAAERPHLTREKQDAFALRSQPAARLPPLIRSLCRGDHARACPAEKGRACFGRDG